MSHGQTRVCDKEEAAQTNTWGEKVEEKGEQIKQEKRERELLDRSEKSVHCSCINYAQSVETRRKKLARSSFLVDITFFPHRRWNVHIKSNIQLKHSFLLSPKPIMHWTRAPYYFIHFVYIRSHGRFIKLDRKWFPVHFSSWFSVLPSVYKYMWITTLECVCAVLAWCDGFFEHPFIIHEIQ